ncbi:MAG: hypothetical protein P8J87_21260, partial [Verrucomicrobiales bacterium]|nr:hypothetical protein [Verrucomicrobiales bacterium]
FDTTEQCTEENKENCGHDNGGWDRGVSTTTDVQAPTNVWAASDGGFFPSSNINTPDLWQFVAVVYRGETVNLHVDDNLVFSFPGNFSFGGQPGSDGVSTHLDLAVGSLNPGGVVHAFNGHIDNFFVYDDAITATQLAAIRDTGPSAALPTLNPPTDTRVLRAQWGFESGDLTGWTTVDPGFGDNLAFDPIDGGQPALTANTDNADIGLTAEGNFHIRTWDGQAGTLGLSDLSTGVLESDPFVLGDNANFEFLVGGGGHHFYGDPDVIDFDITAFNLEREIAPGNWEAIFTASGVGARGTSNGNYFRNGFWDASNYAGETVRFRIYDTHEGGWGHIDVDNIRYSITADVSDPTDTDNDNMGDAWETVFFGDLSRDGTGDFEDPDDGLTDAEEYAAKTQPNIRDTDGDSLTDGAEVKIHLTDPLAKDSDLDGFDDNIEINSGTNPNDINEFPVRTPRRVWNFESGDLAGWTIVDPLIGDNEVFISGGQPAVNANSDNADITGTAEGNFHVRTWDGQAGTLGDLSDAHTGVIESETFVLEPTAQFELLVGGGNHPFTGDPDLIDFDITAVTLERQLAPDDWEAIFTTTGANANSFREITWDAKDYVGESVRLRIYDTHEGGWGHIDADNIRYSIVFDIKNPNQPDDDSDGIGDDWETFYFGDTTTANATSDTDGDGLNDVGEFTACTDPMNKDSDNDGLNDGAEITATSDPLVADSDGDGLNDGAEVNTHNTSPVKADTDDDTWDDPTELAFGTDPRNGALFPIPPENLWSVDIQAVDGPVFAPNEPILMDGLEAAAAAASNGMT